MSGVTGLRYTFARHNEGGTQIHESSPLFERIGNDDFAELQVYCYVLVLLSINESNL